LLINDGEGGLTKAIHRSLCRHPSRAVRSLARAAPFRGRKWFAKSVAARVADYFGVSAQALYQEVRWHLGRERAAPEDGEKDIADSPGRVWVRSAQLS
jgi:hypothetical protein